MAARAGRGKKGGDKMEVKCNKCGFAGDESEFSWGRDFFQKRFVSACPKCDNRQNPGDASMRMMPGKKHPFEFLREKSRGSLIEETFHDAGEAS